MKPAGAQWSLTSLLADAQAWKWWQVRPLAWEDKAANPKLFELSHQFWQGLVDELSKKSYQEQTTPDYRVPERQVVYNETWNLVVNPVHARQQIDTLLSDISRQPLGYHYVWHDTGSHIEGLRPDGNYQGTSQTGYGGWYGGPGILEASYGEPTGTVTTNVPVTTPGRYTMWVLSNPTNLSYTAPWFGKVTVDGREQFTYHHKDKIPSVWMKMGEVTIEKPGDVRVDFTLDGAGFGGTYRRVYTLFLVDDPKIVPAGTVRPAWAMDMFRQRAAKAGAGPNDPLLLWLADDPYRPLSQEVWAEPFTPGDVWPAQPVPGTTRSKDLLMARDTCRAVQVGRGRKGGRKVGSKRGRKGDLLLFRFRKAECPLFQSRRPFPPCLFRRA